MGPNGHSPWPASRGRGTARGRGPRRGVDARGQSISEYAILLGLVIAVLVGIQLYAKRGLQAAVKVAADQLGEQPDGLLDVNPTIEFKVRRASQLTATTTGTRTVETVSGGRVSYGTSSSSVSSGVLADAVFVSRSEQ